jgi:hypothetical protein
LSLNDEKTRKDAEKMSGMCWRREVTARLI